MFESILFDAEDNNALEDLTTDVARMLYCENLSLTDDGCEWCEKFDNQGILDFRIIGNHNDLIKKELIKNTIDELSYSAMEQGKPKITIIRNGEDLKVDAANSLLKFLEEPTKDTYFFIETNDRNSILPTIKSRAKLLSLSNEKENMSEETFIVKIIKTKNKDSILLMNNKMKNLDKNELQDIVKNSMNSFLKNCAIEIYENLLEFYNDLKFSNNPNLAIDRFVIKIAEVI
ncbi:hypothetical protein [Mesoplasma lactucae]|nr:hypothetical protein [Mesoplasma lactucae]